MKILNLLALYILIIFTTACGEGSSLEETSVQIENKLSTCLIQLDEMGFFESVAEAEMEAEEEVSSLETWVEDSSDCYKAYSTLGNCIQATSCDNLSGGFSNPTSHDLINLGLCSSEYEELLDCDEGYGYYYNY